MPECYTWAVLGKAGTFRWMRKKRGLPSFCQCFSVASIQLHLQSFYGWESEATDDLSQEGLGKWDLWEMGKVEKPWRWRSRQGSVSVRALFEVHCFALVSCSCFPQCEPDILSNTHLVCSLYTTTHTHMRPSGHVNLFSHDSRRPFQKKKKGISASVKRCHEASILGLLCIPFWTKALVPAAGS